MGLLTDGFFIGLVGWLVVVGVLWWSVGGSLKALKHANGRETLGIGSKDGFLSGFEEQANENE